MTDEIWNEAARVFEEKELMAIVVQISLINVFNRINCATRQVRAHGKGEGWDTPESGRHQG